jgi:preprotein translocase subunit SecD
VPPAAGRGPGLWLVLGAAVLVLVATVAVAVGLLARGNAGPAKGDLRATFTAFTGHGEPPTPDVLRQVKQILLSRMRAADMARPMVEASGSSVTVTAGSATAEGLTQIAARGRLAFRRVLYAMPDPAPAPPPANGCRVDHPDTTITDKAAALASAKAKLGAAYQVAEAIDRVDYPFDAAALAQLAPFAMLTCTEVAALPVAMQFLIPTLTCAILNARAPDALSGATDQAAACDDLQPTANRYYLDVAKVQGTDVSGAEASFDPAGAGWQVQLHFTGAGQAKWTALTREVTANADQPSQRQVAIVLDSVVISAPEIQSVITGDAVITAASLDRARSKILAAQLRYGLLPVRLIVQSVSAVR